MKQIGLMICGIIISVVSQAQNFDVNFLPDIKKTEPILVRYEDGYYTVDNEPSHSYRSWSPKLSRITHNITVTKYDKSLKEVKAFRLPGPDKSYGPLVPALKVIGNKLYLFYTKLAEDNKILMFMAAIDPATLETGAPTELMVIDETAYDIYYYMLFIDLDTPDFQNTKTMATTRLGFSKSFIVRQSHNGEYCTVAWTSKQNDRLYLALLDKNMKRIQSKIYRLPARSSLSITSASIDNSGNAYFTLTYSKKGDIVHQVYINRKDGSEEVKTIDLPSGSIAGLRTVADHMNDRVWFCGPYTESTDNLAGVYHVALDTKTSVWGSAIKTPFDKDLVEIFDKENWAKTKEKKYGIYPDIMWEANMFNDGILQLTGEFREERHGQKAVFNIAGSILNASFRDNKAVFTRIPKMRVSAGSTYGDSYRIFGYQNNVIVLYNDYPSNLQRSLSEAPERSDMYTYSALVAAIIQPDGSMKREIVIDKSKEDLLSELSTISELQPGLFFVPHRRIKRLGGITDDIQWTIVKHK